MGLASFALLAMGWLPTSHAVPWDPGVPPGPGTLPPLEDDLDVEAPERTRPFLMEVNFRSRWLTVPDSLVDIAFFDQESSGVLAAHPDRPKVGAWSAGLEWVVKSRSANGIVYFEYAGSLVDEGYWDDALEDTPDYADGEYLVPDRLGFVALGADYAHEVHATDWLSFLAGGGLGVLRITGRMIRWRPGSVENPESSLGDPYCTQGDLQNWKAPAYERYAAGCGDDGEKSLPRVLPLVDLNLGVRFHVADRANLRLEGGLHDMFYLGMAAGVEF